jgi:hypothetical protein
MKRLLGMAGSLLLYFGAATFAAAVTGLLVLWMKGHLTHDKVFSVVAAAYDIRVDDASALAAPKEPQVAYAEVLEKRALAGLDLDLREHALDKAMNDLMARQAQLDDDRAKYNLVLSQFETRLAELRAGAADKATIDVLQTLEALSPDQAKQQILKLHDQGHKDDVVTLLKRMSTEVRRKILREFTDADADKLYDILQEILSGSGEGDLIDRVREQVDEFKKSQS